MDNANNNGIRKLPQDIVAEQAVLGSILVSPHPTEAFELATAKLYPRNFLRDSHKVIFEAMISLYEQKREIDIVTITDQLGDKLNTVGGEAYFGELINSTPTSSNLEYYLDIVRIKAMQRDLIEVMNNSIVDAYENNLDVSNKIGEIKTKLDEIEENHSSIDFIDIKDAVNDTINLYVQRGKEGNPVTGLATGFSELDKITTGLHENQLIVLAARPSVGKTAFVLNLAINAANNLAITAEENEKAKPVVMFNLEMNSTQLVDRMLASQAMVSLNEIQTGANQNIKDVQGLTNYERVTVGGNKLNNLNLWIDDTAGININEIRAKLIRLIRDEEQNLGLVIIDYLQLIEGDNNRDRQQQVAQISRSLKRMSMELKVPIIALSQLSRGVESRTNRRPMLSDLRESGAIEQDADIVAFLYREDYYDNESDNSTEDPRDEPEISNVELIIAKNRQGERKNIELMFNKPIQKFSNITAAENQRPAPRTPMTTNGPTPQVEANIDNLLNSYENGEN